MKLKDLKNYFESKDDGHRFPFMLSSPFSWRGVYSEVAFSIEWGASTKADNLTKIEEAYNQTFTGWKGGEFNYDDHTEVNFESEPRSYTDGQYTRDLINQIAEVKFMDAEEYLLNIAFK